MKSKKVSIINVVFIICSIVTVAVFVLSFIVK